MLQDFAGVTASENIPHGINVVKYTTGDILSSNIRPYLKKVWIADRNGGCSTDVLVIKSNEGISKGFLYYSLTNENFISYVMSGAKGVKMPRGDKDQMMKFSLFIPEASEQEKISSFLKLLDERISIQNKIIEDLKKLKVGIADSIIWSNKNLSKRICLKDIGVLKNGYAFKSSTYVSDGKFSIITISNVTGQRYIDTRQCNLLMALPEDLQSHQILKTNDILISLTGNVGRVSLCKEDRKYLLNQRVGLFDINEPSLHEYIFQVLSCHQFVQSMESAAQGAAQMNIGKNDVENFSLPFTTDKSILNNVSLCLRSYDIKIEQEQRVLQQYNLLKHVFLKNLFI